MFSVFVCKPHLLPATAGIEPAPNNRFYTGGDDSIRGFDIRTVSLHRVRPGTSTLRQLQRSQSIGRLGTTGPRTIGVPLLSYTIVYSGWRHPDYWKWSNTGIPLPDRFDVPVFRWRRETESARSQLKLDAGGFDQLQTTFPNVSISNSLQLAPG